MSDVPTVTNEWCAGLPRSSRRTLTAAERAELKREARRLLAVGCLSAIVAPVAFLFVPFAGYLIPPLKEIPSPAAVLMVMLMTVGAALLVLHARSSLRRGRSLARDAQQGVADRFEGLLPMAAESEPTLRRLLRRGLLQEHSPEPQWFELLTCSGKVWRVNGQRPGGWVSAACVEVAETPEFASIAAEWLDIEDGAEDVRTSQRDLSTPEVEELRRYARRLSRRRLLPTLLFAAWATAGLWNGPPAPGGAPGSDLLPTLLVVLIAAVTFVLYLALFRWFYLSYRIGRDAGIGRVVIVRVPVPPDEEDQDTQPVHRVLEFLPSSRGLWTSDGHPAPWRLSTDP